MNYLTDERGKIIEPVNPLSVRDVGVAQEIEAVTGETVTFQTGAAGFAGTVSLDKGPIMNLIGDKVGSYWKQPKNLRVQSGPRASSGVAKVTAVTETATSATVTITDTGYNLENLFETTVGSRRAIIVLRDSTGDELYGWIGGIAKTSDSYVLDVYNAPSSGAQSWVGTLADYTFNAQLPIFEIYTNETSLVWTTGTILLREVKFEPGADESSFLNGLTNGDFALDYSTRKLYYKKATTGTSDTVAYSVAKTYQTATISGTVTVDSEFPAAAAMADAAANSTTTNVDARNMGFNGTTWDRLRTAVTTVSATLTGMLNNLPWAIFNTTPTTRTNGQGGPLETDATGNLRNVEQFAAKFENNADETAFVTPRPIMSSTGAITTDISAALEASSVTKASPGRLLQARIRLDSTLGTATYYIQFHNAASLPADGTSAFLVAPIKVQHTTGTDSLVLVDYSTMGGVYGSIGLVMCISTTEFTKTIGTAHTASTIFYA